MASSEFISVQPSKEYKKGNPYTALIGTEDNFDAGLVNIEPPCVLAEEYLQSVAGDVGVLLVHEMTSQVASRFSYSVMDSGVWAEKPSKKRVKYTVQTVLDELGQTSNPELFRKIYPVD